MNPGSATVVVHFSMVVVGGLGSVWGAVLGAGLLVGFQEVLRAFKSVQEIGFGPRERQPLGDRLALRDRNPIQIPQASPLGLERAIDDYVKQYQAG